MSDLNVAATSTTPGISACSETGRVSLIGDSYPENSFEFFAQVIAWIEHYLKVQDSNAPLHLELRLVYMNTSSVKAMMDIFDLLEDAHKNERPVSVSWHYDPRNERVVELADEFREDCSFPFEIIAIA